MNQTLQRWYEMLTEILFDRLQRHNLGAVAQSWAHRLAQGPNTLENQRKIRQLERLGTALYGKYCRILDAESLKNVDQAIALLEAGLEVYGLSVEYDAPTSPLPVLTSPCLAEAPEPEKTIRATSAIKAGEITLWVIEES